MKILIYGINYSPELTGIGKYTGEMARWLAEQGHDVRVITAPPYYPEWKVAEGYSGYWYKTTFEEGVRVTRCPLYVPAKQSTIKRLVHLSSFAISSGLALFGSLRWRPDRVIQLAPSLFCCPFTIAFSKLSGAKSLLHIQDFEIDALFGLGMASGNRIKSLAFSLESKTYNCFDRVSSISPSMVQRLVNKGAAADKTLLFPNWSETARFREAKKSPTLLRELGVRSDKKILLYSGNIGEKQGLEDLLDGAEKMLSSSDAIFLVVGDGASKKRLMESANIKNLKNIIFAPLQPYDLLPTLLASADVHLVIQKRGAADAVLPSKLTNILAVGGNTVITADADTSLGQLCHQHPNIAIRVEPESVEGLYAGIQQALKITSKNDTASDYALKYLDKDYILNQFFSDLEAI